MEITSELEEIVELNVPVLSTEHRQGSIEQTERASAIKLLPDNYLEPTSLNNANQEMKLVEEKKFLCCESELTELFEFCKDVDCNMPIVELTKNYVGCVLEIRWICKSGHRGDWQSSKIVSQVC